MPSSRFQPGSLGGPGRPKGSRNKLAESFLDALHKDFQQHGVEAIVAARTESPLGYVRMVASLLPQKLQVEGGTGAISDAELVAIIRQAGDETEPADCGTVDGRVH